MEGGELGKTKALLASFNTKVIAPWGMEDAKNLSDIDNFTSLR